MSDSCLEQGSGGFFHVLRRKLKALLPVIKYGDATQASAKQENAVGDVAMGKKDLIWQSAGKAISCLTALPLAALLLVGAPAKAAEVVGTTSAKFGVTPHGAASYSVPIAVPPGTMDLKPELVLQYNSHDENGLLGVGWTITGLSHITRCPTDLYVDDPAKGGIGIDPVDYDDNDKFCLNGQRLVAESGAYGADGTEYRTNLRNSRASFPMARLMAVRPGSGCRSAPARSWIMEQRKTPLSVALLTLVSLVSPAIGLRPLLRSACF